MTDTPRTFRQRLGLTQEGLAQKLGVSVSTVSKWERKEKPQAPSRLVLRLLKPLGYRDGKG